MSSCRIKRSAVAATTADHKQHIEVLSDHDSLRSILESQLLDDESVIRKLKSQLRVESINTVYDADRRTPLTIACELSSDDVVFKLLEWGADLFYCIEAIPSSEPKKNLLPPMGYGPLIALITKMTPGSIVQLDKFIPKFIQGQRAMAVETQIKVRMALKERPELIELILPWLPQPISNQTTSLELSPIIRPWLQFATADVYSSVLHVLWPTDSVSVLRLRDQTWARQHHPVFTQHYQASHYTILLAITLCSTVKYFFSDPTDIWLKFLRHSVIDIFNLYQETEPIANQNRRLNCIERFALLQSMADSKHLNLRRTVLTLLNDDVYLTSLVNFLKKISAKISQRQDVIELCLLRRFYALIITVVEVRENETYEITQRISLLKRQLLNKSIIAITSRICINFLTLKVVRVYGPQKINIVLKCLFVIKCLLADENQTETINIEQLNELLPLLVSTFDHLETVPWNDSKYVAIESLICDIIEFIGRLPCKEVQKPFWDQLGDRYYDQKDNYAQNVATQLTRGLSESLEWYQKQCANADVVKELIARLLHGLADYILTRWNVDNGNKVLLLFVSISGYDSMGHVIIDLKPPEKHFLKFVLTASRSYPSQTPNNNEDTYERKALAMMRNRRRRKMTRSLIANTETVDDDDDTEDERNQILSGTDDDDKEDEKNTGSVQPHWMRRRSLDYVLMSTDRILLEIVNNLCRRTYTNTPHCTDDILKIRPTLFNDVVYRLCQKKLNERKQMRANTAPGETTVTVTSGQLWSYEDRILLNVIFWILYERLLHEADCENELMTIVRQSNFFSILMDVNFMVHMEALDIHMLFCVTCVIVSAALNNENNHRALLLDEKENNNSLWTGCRFWSTVRDHWKSYVSGRDMDAFQLRVPVVRKWSFDNLFEQLQHAELVANTMVLEDELQDKKTI